jgi:hypothetical protein
MPGAMFPPIFVLKLPVVKAKVPRQHRPRKRRVGFALVYQRCDDVRLLLRMLNQKTMIFQKSKDLWWKTQDVDLLSLDLLWASHDFDPLCLTRKRTWVWIWRPLREGIQMLSKLVGSVFQLPPTFLTCCPYGEKRIVVPGRKLVLRTNAKKFSWPIVHHSG